MSFQPTHTDESSSSSYSPPSCIQFTLPQIQLATNNFDESRLLGTGGFARVYRGSITYQGRDLVVAIKRLKPGTITHDEGDLVAAPTKEELAFWYEVAMLSNLRHPHLVSLIGYCSDGREMIFVYDYMPRGTLEDRLHKREVPLSWVRRLKICLDTARGLEYLHSKLETKPKVLHLDIKSSNILLASNWAAKLSDFGLSKVRPTGSTYLTNQIGGTPGYLDPEYVNTWRPSEKTDVFAFGVVMCEVFCGKKAVHKSTNGEYISLARWAQDFIKNGKLEEIMDPNLKGRISSKCSKEFAMLADRCMHNRPEQRPSMAKVVKDLESILTLQEKTNGNSLIKRFGRMTSGEKTSVGGINLKSLDRYLYTVGDEHCIVHRFDFNTIVQATENFSEASKFWDGEYKFMYKGTLQNRQDITITHYSVVNIDICEECKNDASVVVKLEHENVIQLLGYCIDRRNVYLVHGFSFKATLGGLIFGGTRNILDWDKRRKIILGVAKGLVYLHNHAPIQIIHADVNPETILLDENFEPKLSGFWFAKTTNQSDRVPIDPKPGNL